jgi:hypothetical protein
MNELDASRTGLAAGRIAFSENAARAKLRRYRTRLARWRDRAVHAPFRVVTCYASTRARDRLTSHNINGASAVRAAPPPA